MGTTEQLYPNPVNRDRQLAIQQLEQVKQDNSQPGDATLITDFKDVIVISILPNGGEFAQQRFSDSQAGFNAARSFIKTTLQSVRKKDKDVLSLPHLVRA